MIEVRVLIAIVPFLYPTYTIKSFYEPYSYILFTVCAIDCRFRFLCTVLCSCYCIRKSENYLAQLFSLYLHPPRCPKQSPNPRLQIIYPLFCKWHFMLHPGVCVQYFIVHAFTACNSSSLMSVCVVEIFTCLRAFRRGCYSFCLCSRYSSM